jgi:hypothetical protein
MRIALIAAAALATACGVQTGPEEGSLNGSCVTDFACPTGEECGAGGCGPVAASLYPHIQLASALLANYATPSDIPWRAEHYDLLIGGLYGNVDLFRTMNPDARLFEYVLMRKHPDGPSHNPGEVWARSAGYDPEDFYLHYREDVARADLSGVVIVPGYPTGLVPGWNPAPAPEDPPASAASRTESRVPLAMGSAGVMYMPAMGHSGYRTFIADHAGNIMDGSYYGTPAASGPVDGIVCDVALYYPEFDEADLGHTERYGGVPLDDNHPYARAYETIYPELAQRLHDRFGKAIDVMPNYGHVYFLEYDSPFPQNLQRTTPWGWGEVWLMYNGGSSPTRGANRVINWERDYETAIASIVRRTRAGARRVLGARDLPAAGGTGSDRGRIFLLALYYMVHNSNTWLLYETLNSHGGAGLTLEESGWNPAVEFDIGAPVQVPSGFVDFEGRSGTLEHYVMYEGPDAYDPALTTHLLARRFENGLVLAKMLPDGSVVDDRSITTHTLDGSYYILQPDGTLGPVVTEATLRNNEALILIPAD